MKRSSTKGLGTPPTLDTVLNEKEKLMKKKRRFLFILALTLAAPVGLTGCVGDTGSPTDDSQDSVEQILSEIAAITDDAERKAYLVKEAAENGPVVIYTTQNRVLVEAMNIKIDADFPEVDIEFVHQPPGEALERFLAETFGGSPIASLVQMDAAATSTFMQEDVLAPYPSPLLQGIDDGLKDKDGYYVASTQIFYVMGYNTDLNDGSNLPSTWEELAERADLTGQVARTDVGGATRWVAAMLAHYGDEKGMKILNSLAGQEPRLFESNPAMWEALQSGQIAIGYDTPVDFLINFQNAGAPIGYQIVEPVFRQLQYSSISSIAPNPWGAALVVDWLLSVDGAHQLYNDIPIGGVNPDHSYIHQDLFSGIKLATYDVESLEGDPNRFTDIFIDLFR